MAEDVTMRTMIDKVKGWFKSGRPPGKTALQQNAEKALEMKRRAGSDHHVPDHRTAHDGGVKGPQVGYSDTGIGKEPTFASNLKRSHNARSGDA